MRILAVDPGTTNFAYALLDVKKSLRYKIVSTGMVKNTVKEPKDNVYDQFHSFSKEFLESLPVDSIDGFICERFQSRGMKGTVIESVNMMIGFMIYFFMQNADLDRNIKLVTASTWKNRVNKISNIKEFYEKCRVPNHVADAACLALYYSTLLYKGTSFDGFQDHHFSLLAEKLNNESVPFS